MHYLVSGGPMLNDDVQPSTEGLKYYSSSTTNEDKSAAEKDTQILRVDENDGFSFRVINKWF
jgi:hypothetical protein